MKAAREIRDSRPQPPSDGSLSAQLAGELGADKGVPDDPINDRAEEAARWCELIMKSERRDRLLALYNSSGSEWLHNRLLGVLDDCLEYNPSDKPLFLPTVLGHNFDVTEVAGTTTQTAESRQVPVLGRRSRPASG